MSFSDWDYVSTAKVKQVIGKDTRWGDISYGEEFTINCSWQTDVNNTAFTGFDGTEFLVSHFVYSKVKLNYQDLIKINDEVGWKTIKAITTWSDNTFNEELEYRYALDRG